MIKMPYEEPEEIPVNDYDEGDAKCDATVIAVSPATEAEIREALGDLSSLAQRMADRHRQIAPDGFLELFKDENQSPVDQERLGYADGLRHAEESIRRILNKVGYW